VVARLTLRTHEVAKASVVSPSQSRLPPTKPSLLREFIRFCETSLGTPDWGESVTLRSGDRLETAPRRMEGAGVALTSSNQLMAELAIDWAGDLGSKVQTIRGSLKKLIATD
jgi:hypothetical protein